MQYWPADAVGLGGGDKDGKGGVMQGLVRFLRRMRKQGERAAVGTVLRGVGMKLILVFYFFCKKFSF